MEVAGVHGPPKPLNLDGGANTGQKPRLSESDVKLILALRSEACPTPEDSERAVHGPPKPLNLDGGANTGQKPRLSESDVKLILALRSEACPTPEDSERAALARRIDAMWNEFRDGVVEQFFTKGYVEVEHGYFAERARSEAWAREMWAKLDFSKFDLCRPGDEGLDDFVVRPGEDAEEAIYYGQE